MSKQTDIPIDTDAVLEQRIDMAKHKLQFPGTSARLKAALNELRELNAQKKKRQAEREQRARQ